MWSVMTFKRLMWLQLLCVIVAMVAAYYVQVVMAIAPCPLCILQRVAYLTVGFLSVIAWLHYPKRWGQDVYLTLIALFLLAGLCVALYQVWLEYQPVAAPNACGHGLDPLLAALPSSAWLSDVFASHAQCNISHWKVLGLSMAGWSAVLFIMMLVMCLVGWSKVKPVNAPTSKLAS